MSRLLDLSTHPWYLSDVTQDLRKRRQDNLWLALVEKCSTERLPKLVLNEDDAS